jgi:cobalt-zinc-cadmium efflux system outer membrane protein
MPTTHFIRAIGLLCALVVQSLPLGAQTSHAADTLVLSLAEARRAAAEANPELLAASWRTVAARGDVRTAGALPFNPVAVFEARSPSDGLASRYEAEVGLEIEVAGQRGLRAGASRAYVEAETNRFRDEARGVLATVERAYHHLAAAEQRLALAHQVDSLTARLGSAVSVQLAEGEVSRMEANLVGIEAARARARAVETLTSRTAAESELGRLLGLDASVPLRTICVLRPGGAWPPPPPLEAAVEAALGGRPDLRALNHAAEGARGEARLARRQTLPNLRVAALSTREDPATDPRFGVSLGLELPLFNRNQGLVDRRDAELAEVEGARRAVELRVQAEVESALNAYAASLREVEILEQEMLAPIRQNQELLEIAFREGKIDLASLLLLRNQLLDAELGYWAAWERMAIARSELAAATGEILDGVDFVEGGGR